MEFWTKYAYKRSFTIDVIRPAKEFDFSFNKDARYCAYAHNVSTPLIHIFDLIGYQMMKR